MNKPAIFPSYHDMLEIEFAAQKRADNRADNRFDEGTFTLGSHNSRGAYVHTPDDAQGEWIPMCEACITADGLEARANDWLDDDEWSEKSCACCGE